MPQQAQNNMKGTSPSKAIQENVNKDWGAQQKGTTNPQQALNDKHTNHPYPVDGLKK